MQVISRRADEGIVIGREIELKVLEIGNNWVDIEIRSTDDGDSQVVRLQLPVADEDFDREQLEELELVLC